MKEAGTTHWLSPNTGATNKSGFSALPGGSRDSDGDFGGIEHYGHWWSSTEYSTSSAWYWGLYYSNTNVYRYFDSKVFGFSVRCLRD
jgi:uncharacterized protein (TIGR02145 family)